MSDNNLIQIKTGIHEEQKDTDHEKESNTVTE